MGEQGVPKSHWILKLDIFLLNFQQKDFFLSFVWVKRNFTTSGPRWKNPFGYPWKNPLLVNPWKNPLDAHSSINIF